MRVSIIITNFNYSLYISRAIQSALNQITNEKNFYEVIVVDDCSTDNSKEVINSYGNQIIPIFNDTNSGLPFSINRGIRNSKGMYIVRLDADDWIDKNFVQIMSFFLDRYKNYHYVWPDYNVYDCAENIIDIISKPLGAGIMFRKQTLIEVGLYDEEMKIHEDRDMLLKCQKYHLGYHLKLPLYKYYKHGKNMTTNKTKMNEYEKKLYKKHNIK